MNYPKTIQYLGDPWDMIYGIKDPVQFIDMLCANAYFSGAYKRKMPVNQQRTVFLAWLERNRKTPLKEPPQESR